MASHLIRPDNYEKHNLSRTPEYTAWINAKVRCYDSSHKHFKDYGGRGIKMCTKWRNSFIAFYEDMGKRPSEQHTLDRINNNGDYTPLNCRWTTRTIQAQNRRCYSRLGFKGVRKQTKTQTYYAYTRHNKQYIYLGSFKTKEEAAYMYDCFAISIYGDKAKTNFDYAKSPFLFRG